MKNNKGFAISGMIYPILILSIFLIVELLVTLQSRKMILDKNKDELLNDINNGQVYKKYENGEAIYFNPETNQKCNASEAKSTTGTKTGCMKWYTFNDSETSDKVNVILDHNTTAKVAWNSSGNNADGMKEVKNALENDTRSWDTKLNARLIEANEVAKITGNTGFDATIKGKDNWFYFENNGQDKPSLSQGQAKYKWLFDYTGNCTNNGCSIADNSTYGYWTSTPANSNPVSAWYVYSNGSLYSLNVNGTSSSGVRPVITISKSILDKPAPTLPPKLKYENGEAIYFNPETNKKCSADEANSATGIKSGCMKWHAFNDSEGNGAVNVILDHNTTEKVVWNSTGMGSMLEVKTALQNDTAKWNSSLSPRLIGVSEITQITGKTNFNESDQYSSYYLDTNSGTADPNRGPGTSKYKWLFNYTLDCTKWGCSEGSMLTNGYWTSSPTGLTGGAWAITGYGMVNSDYMKYDYYGVRPVITISKSLLK